MNTYKASIGWMGEMRERALASIFSYLKQKWAFLLLIPLFVTLFINSIWQADWVKDSSPLILSVVLGIILGLFLASSRFSGWFVALYSFLISIPVQVQLVERILPSWNELVSSHISFYELMAQTNARLFISLSRIYGWIAVLSSGKKIEDSRFFLLLFGWIVWSAGIWLMWSIIRRNQALVGVLPFGILLGFNVYLSGEDINNFLVYIFLTAMLIAATAYEERHKDWEKRGMDYPEELGWEWGSSVLLAAGVICFFAWAAQLFGTPEGWNKLNELFKGPRNQINNLADRLFDVNPPRPKPGPSVKPLVNAQVPELGLIGSPIPGSSDTIMWVEVSDFTAMPPIEPGVILQSVPKHYWRGEIYGVYTGKGWERAQLSDTPPPTGALTAAPEGRFVLKQHFVIEALHENLLFAVNNPVEAGKGTSLRYIQPEDKSTLLEGNVSDYVVTSWATQVSITQLNQAPTSYPPNITATYLQLPVSLPARVRDLATRITAGAETPYDKAVRIQEFLRQNYKYKLDIPPVPANQDAVDYFLFDAPGGFCSYYASAMAVMLRSVGVPARVVTGYATGEADPTKGAFRVPASASHAWVEVYFPNYDWIEFEPTTSETAFIYPAGIIKVSPTKLPGKTETKFEWNAVNILGLVVLTGILFLPAIIIRYYIRRKKSIKPYRKISQRLYWQMRGALTAAGLGAAPSVTPSEFLSTCQDQLISRNLLMEAVQRLTRIYLLATYSSRPPGESDVLMGQWAWRRAIPDWIWFWLVSNVKQYLFKRKQL